MMRRELEGYFGPEYGDFIEIMAALRPEVRSRISDGEKRQKVMERLSSPEMLEMIRSRGAKETEAEMRRIVAEEAAGGGP